MGKLRDLKKYIERKVLKWHDPDFLIIGTQKSGTTTLFYFLNKHPRLAGSWPKEIGYFSRLQYLGKDLNWYRSHFTSFKRNALFFEATPNYINFEEIAKQLKQLYPNIKLIVILRDPIERAYSAWNMYREHYKNGKLKKRLPPPSPNEENMMYKNLTEGRTDYPTFREVIDMEYELIRKGEPRGVNFLRKGLYFEQINSYFKYFDRNQLLILGIKDLNKNPQALVDKVLQFLNVESDWKIPPLKERNRRAYGAKISDDDKELLTEFYKESNQKLKDLLGYQVNW